jgi:hypothetical protein
MTAHLIPEKSLFYVVGANISVVYCLYRSSILKKIFPFADPSELYWGITDVPSVHMHALISTMSKHREITGTLYMATIEFSSGVRFEFFATDKQTHRLKST